MTLTWGGMESFLATEQCEGGYEEWEGPGPPGWDMLLVGRGQGNSADFLLGLLSRGDWVQGGHLKVTAPPRLRWVTAPVVAWLLPGLGRGWLLWEG